MTSLFIIYLKHQMICILLNSTRDKINLRDLSLLFLDPNLSLSFISFTHISLLPIISLESVLHTFSALTEGDIFEIVYNDQQYSFSVLETQPRYAIDITNTDIEVDFVLETTQTETLTQREKVATDPLQLQSEPKTLKGQTIGNATNTGEPTVKCDNWYGYWLYHFFTEM
jgi:hypothetical protein